MPHTLHTHTHTHTHAHTHTHITHTHAHHTHVSIVRVELTRNLFENSKGSDRGRVGWEGPNDVFGWVARQGMIEGLDLVDFNYPQHLENDEAKQMQDPTLNLG